MRTQNMGPYLTWVSQILIMHIISLIIMSFNILIMKHQNILKMNNMKACKHNWELEIVTKTNRAHLYVSKPRWSSHQTPLESDASSMSSLGSERIHFKAPLLSRHVRAHTYIKYNRGGLWYPYSFGSMGLAPFLT